VVGLGGVRLVAALVEAAPVEAAEAPPAADHPGTAVRKTSTVGGRG